MNRLHRMITGLLSLLFLIIGCWQGYQMAGILGAAVGAPVGALAGLVIGAIGWYALYLIALFS